MLYEKFLNIIRFGFYISVAFTAVMFIINRIDAEKKIDNFNRYEAGLTAYEKKTAEQSFYYQLTVVLLLGFIFFSVIKPPSWHLVEVAFKKLEEIIESIIGIRIDTDGMSSEGKLGKPLNSIDVNF